MTSTRGRNPYSGGSGGTAPTARTLLVLDGFLEDIGKDERENFTRDWLGPAAANTRDFWGPGRYQSFAKIDLLSPDAMWKFIKSKKGPFQDL